MRNFKYYNGEDKNPYGKDTVNVNPQDWELMQKNPKAFWWDFESMYGFDFDSIAMAVENLAYKHSEFAPISEQEIIGSYDKNAVLK